RLIALNIINVFLLLDLGLYSKVYTLVMNFLSIMNSLQV
ncbi:MAG: hypothetical protein ACI85E_001450, partial [Marinomonas primoryensis]